MGGVSAPVVTEIPPLLADAVSVAQAAVVESGEGPVGAHLGVEAVDEASAIHRFAADLPGYGGWQWAVVVAAPPGSETVTVSELALLPGPDALVAPTWVPWDERIRPGDLAPGDLLPPRHEDVRLVPGYLATGDPAVDDVALELGLGRKQVMSREGRLEAAERWAESDFGPDSPMAKAAPGTCVTCGFYLALQGSLSAAFGVCGNELAADGHVVHAAYGCGAHSDTEGPTGAGSPAYAAYDDGALETTPTENTEPRNTEPRDTEAVTDITESSSTL
ncbi:MULTISPECIES: DUF3027 domain-containing protein [unclassified Rhodococcus (in: high G+C Gram-positive bacteria)]|uniref:DUF3027 domain-containing protein n=1 Tax=unclassified Rhodococcus (in: high G+C Gram-positive bacteria) TaxID=192944 RepID=UPI00068D9CB7|nr:MULTISPECIES: DUF3027 domain-containing protein [unclassified Rhodococcus (in: high G+C Gram-positive bacteria)]